MSTEALSHWIEHRMVPGVRAISTLRGGTADDFGWEQGTLARSTLREVWGWDASPVWMRQVHGTECVDLDSLPRGAEPTADAGFTRQVGRVVVVLTADCLPVFLSSRDGGIVAVVHAGWRSLAAGVIEATVRRMACDPAALVAAFGPGIGPSAYEVGPELRACFLDTDPAAAAAFQPGQGDRWWANLYHLAGLRLSQLGVTPPSTPSWCTLKEHRFHSWRRDGRTSGRMAHLIWRTGSAISSTPARRVVGR